MTSDNNVFEHVQHKYGLLCSGWDVDIASNTSISLCLSGGSSETSNHVHLHTKGSRSTVTAHWTTGQ